MATKKQGLIAHYDKNGKIYYTDKNGNRIKNQTNLTQRLSNNTKAFLTNVNDWLNNSNPDSEAYKQKANIALTLATLPIGAGAKVTQTIAKPLVPYVGKQIAKTIGQGVGAGAASGAVEGFGRGLIEHQNPILTATTDSLLGAGFGGLGGLGVGKVIRGIEKYNNPWFVDDVVKNDKNAVQYIYDKINPKNSNRLQKVETPEVIRNLRMESGLPNGRGAYTQRSYRNPKDGVIAQYYPTKELKNNFKVRDFDTSKYNELTPNDDATAQLYHDTLKGVKDKFGKVYDTVSLHPVEEYKNMRLFLSPDKANGFAIKPDGDIVSVFGSKEGSGASHSMLELALQNKGTKLDNYDVPRLRNIYDNHNFEVVEKTPWDDEFWKPEEWDKEFMLKEYGVAEPDITYRQINNTNIYPEMQKTRLAEQLLDALK